MSFARIFWAQVRATITSAAFLALLSTFAHGANISYKMEQVSPSGSTKIVGRYLISGSTTVYEGYRAMN